jgi:hypothetical protein
VAGWFIGGENERERRKPSTCPKSQTKVIQMMLLSVNIKIDIVTLD